VVLVPIAIIYSIPVRLIHTVHLLDTPEYIKNQSYQNITITKVDFHFLYSSMKKKLRRIRLIFDVEKLL
jgi:hypothetical protein